MADRHIKILTPADSFALLTLDELKNILGSTSSDVGTDAELQQMIDWYSAYVGRVANRVFARERVRETWRDTNDRRIFLSHWPVRDEDIEIVEIGGVATSNWELEEHSGKMSFYGGITTPVTVTYTGGYDLPFEAPDDLKNAASLLMRQAKTEAQQQATAGIRSISHKGARVMFFDPSKTSSSTSSSVGGGTESLRAVHALLYHYSRIEV